MSWPKKLWTRFFGPRPEQDIEGDHRQLSLLRLPHELLLSIVDFLDEADRACLSLCNHSLGHRLGDHFWDKLRIDSGSRDQRRDFLLRLVRDHPRHFFCYSCSHLHLSKHVQVPCSETVQARPPYFVCDSSSRLHLADDAKVPRLASRQRSQLRCIRQAGFQERPKCFKVHQAGSAYGFVFQHLQLAMARHRHGPGHGIALDTLGVVEVQEPGHHDSDGVATLMSVDARIILDELCLRVQQWIVFDQDQVPNTANTWSLVVCCHINRTLAVGRAESKWENLIRLEWDRLDQGLSLIHI